jgi:hypothetical protein
MSARRHLRTMISMRHHQTGFRASTPRGWRIATALVLVLLCSGLAARAAAADPAPTIVLTVSTNPAQPSDLVTLTATITGATTPGTVWFVDGAVTISASIPVAPSAGTPTVVTLDSTFPAGTHTLTADYRDAGFMTYASAPVTLTVGSAIAPSDTTVSLTVTPTPILAGAPETLTAVVSRVGSAGVPTGSVEFLDNGVALAPGGSQVALVGGTATYVATGFAPGPHTITANYLGDPSDNPSHSSVSSTVPLPSGPVQTTTTVTVSPATIVAGGLVTLSAHVVQTNGTLAPPQGSIVTFTTNNGATFVAQAALDANGDAVARDVPGWVSGSYDVKASYVGSESFGTSSAHVSLNVIPAAIPLTVKAPSLSGTYGIAVPVLAPTYSGFAPGDSSSSLTTPATCTTTATATSAPGAYAVTCSGATSPIYLPTYVAGSITIAKAPLTVAAPSVTITAGQPIPLFTPALTGFENGETLATSDVTGAASCTTTATATSVAGTYPITCTVGTLTSTNYAFAGFTAGTLTVASATPPMICVRPADWDDHDEGNDAGHDRGRNSVCEALLSEPSGGAKAEAGKLLTINYQDETPIGTGALAPSAVVLGIGGAETLPVTVTTTSRSAKRYEARLTFTVPSSLPAGVYAVLLTVHDSDGHLDQRIWVLTVKPKKPSGPHDRDDR